MEKKAGGLLSLIQWRDFRLKLFVEGTVVGVFVGFTIVAFRYFLEKAEELRGIIYAGLKTEPALFTVLWFIILLIIAGILTFIVKKVPMSGGSGIPQVKGVLAGQYQYQPIPLLVGKFLGGVLGIGAGLSLGREGPSIQLGASIGEAISQRLGRLKIEEKYLMTSGASAGLAAAFNAPLAGVIFALEELHKNFSPAVLMGAMAASLSADVVAQYFFGQQPVFHIQDLPILPLQDYFYLIGLGIICGVFGWLFNRALITSLAFYEHSHIPKPLWPAVPLMLAGVLGFGLPEVLGGGNRLVEALGKTPFPLQILLLLLVVKFLFTMLSYGSGVPGGIFLPLLVIGALTGNVYGNVLVNVFSMSPHFVFNFVVFAMAAYFTAIVKAPITGSILITEMTGSFHHLLALIVVSMTAYVVSDLLKTKPVYEMLYERSLAKQKQHISDTASDSNSNSNSNQGLTPDPDSDSKNPIIIEAAICMNSVCDGIKIKAITWPKGCLIVNIKRGEAEIIPSGDTTLKAGDYVYALVEEKQAVKLHEALLQLTGECEVR